MALAEIKTLLKTIGGIVIGDEAHLAITKLPSRADSFYS
jgi:hypothetical protein